MSLKQELRRRIFDDMLSRVAEKDKVFVLCLDRYTSRIVSSCARMYDVMEVGVLVLQNITLGRERLPDVAGLYFVEPTLDVVRALVEDFKDPKKPQYKNAHLFFTREVGSEEMATLRACKPLLAKVKTFTELNVDFVAEETRCFTFGDSITQSIPRLYFPDSAQIYQDEIEKQAKRLVNLCLTLHEQPYVRYWGGSKIPVARDLARAFDAEFKKATSRIKTWTPNQNRDRGTLLIVDRSVDPVAPLMHEYTYQAMLYDLLPTDGELVTPKGASPAAAAESRDRSESKDEKKAADDEEKLDDTFVLSEDDPLWIEFRHAHIGQVIGDVTKKFREFKTGNKMAKLQNNQGDLSVKEMIAAMKDMPSYKAMMQKYHKHLSLAQECMTRFQKDELKGLGEFEQDMTTGLNNDGKAIVAKEVKTSLVKLCQSPSVSIENKLRLLMIYHISQGGIEEHTRKELMKNIPVRLQKAVLNLQKLGVDFEIAFKGNKSKHSKTRLQEFEKRASSIPLALMRYIPVLHAYLQPLVSFELPEKEFPQVGDAGDGGRKSVAASARRPTARSVRAQWRGGDKNKPEEKEDTRPRFILFVVGGISYSEIRSVYEVANDQKAALFCGSSATLKPKEYIQGLASLTSAEMAPLLEPPKAGAAPLSVADDDDDE